MTTPSPQPAPAPGQHLTAEHWRQILAHSPLLFDVLSDSMKPTFSRGERVLIRPLQDGEPRPGQILAYHNHMLVTHRYYGSGRCAGDNAIAYDAPIPREAMVGIVTHVERRGKLITLKEWSRTKVLWRRVKLWLHQ